MDTAARERIGARVRDLRRAKDWTQQDLAVAAGAATGLISGIETGAREPKLESLQKVARALQVPLSRLVDDESEPPKEPDADHR